MSRVAVYFNTFGLAKSPQGQCILKNVWKKSVHGSYAFEKVQATKTFRGTG